MCRSRELIQRNLDLVRSRIAGAAERGGRKPEAVRLVAVTKSVGISEVETLMDLGQVHLGENRLAEARSKIEACPDGAVWHMIGTIQRRKVRDVVRLFHRVDSLDRLALAEALERHCAEIGKVCPVLIEINVSGESSKHGFAASELPQALAELRLRMPHLDVTGLMTMAPLLENAEAVRPVFRSLYELASEHGLKELSMGMSNDYEVAIEEGATEVRVGTALFKSPERR